MESNFGLYLDEKYIGQVIKEQQPDIHKRLNKIYQSNRKIVYRHVWKDYKDEVIKFTKTDKGEWLYKRRKETIARSFADSKNLHGL